MRGALKSAAVAFLACLCLGACLGKAPPVEEYLRLGHAGKDCGAKTGKDALALAIKPFSALDNLNRQAVLTAKGRVLTPSMAWYWEASPEELVQQAIIADASCLEGFAGAVEYRSRVVHDAGLTGTLTAFNLQEDGGLRFIAAARFELWSANYKKLLASMVVESERPVAALDAQSVADAASQALAELSEKTMAWIASSRQLIVDAKL